MTQFPLVIGDQSECRPSNLPEFIALLKASPDKYTFGSGGVGGSSHIPVETVQAPGRRGDDCTCLSADGSLSSAALLGGQIDLIIDGLAPQLGNIAEGACACWASPPAARTPFLPDAPAMSETCPDTSIRCGWRYSLRRRRRSAIVDRLAAEIGKAVKDPMTK